MEVVPRDDLERLAETEEEAETEVVPRPMHARAPKGSGKDVPTQSSSWMVLVGGAIALVLLAALLWGISGQ